MASRVDTSKGDALRIVVLVDDIAPEDRRAAVGFSALVETDDDRILFDTGPDGDLLLEALVTEGLDVADLDMVVVSHDHKDHVGGLPRLLYERPRLPVSAPLRSALGITKMIPREAMVTGEEGPRELAPNIRTTGDLKGEVSEQALVVATEDGNVVLTGCGHSGLGMLLAAAGGNVVYVVGGLHDLADEDIALTSLDGLLACHCTPKKKLLAHTYDWIDVGTVGTFVELEPPVNLTSKG
jgi:7,8-dihydropterin-6-yl-methyl-4-(beta-D-ribofuranosyl)aminobenzene 5'-phosphate synthase